MKSTKNSCQYSSLVQCSPSLALIKYWGKSDTRSNLPASPSLAITLDTLRSETRVQVVKTSILGQSVPDLMILDGKDLDLSRYSGFFDSLRTVFGKDLAFWAESTNNFPSNSGLASSSSGFAALSWGVHTALDTKLDLDLLSSLARLGSGSAARSLYGGFTFLNANSEAAQALAPEDFWPELRVIIVRIQDGEKEVPSRDAMERSRLSSPYYDAWIQDSQKVCEEAKKELLNKDLSLLGPLIRKSYLRMFSTMFSSDPPIIYWQAKSLEILKVCENLRTQGFEAWETMDAGPQIKIFCLENQLDPILNHLKNYIDPSRILVDKAGPGPRVLKKAELLGAFHPRILEEAQRLGLTIE